MAGIPHPFDPLTHDEVQSAIKLIGDAHGKLFYNVVSLHEPRKVEMLAWIEDSSGPRPARIADVVVIAPGGKVYEGLVDLATSEILSWEHIEGVQPIVSLLGPTSNPIVLSIAV